MSKDNSEPAFPRDHRFDGHNGMTLRDYFAIEAAPILAVSHCDPHAAVIWVRPQYYAALAADCYAFADAMIAERNK